MAESSQDPPVTDETLEKVPVPPAEEPSAMDEAEEKDPPPPEAEGKVPEGGEGEEEEEEEEEEQDLALADELFEKGSSAIEANELDEAVDCLSRALEIRVAHHGELAFECATSYYKYGCALLYKAQEEADPLGNVPKNNSSKSSSADANVKIVDESASSKAAVNSEEEVGQREKAQDEDGRGEVDDEDLADEDDSDLDLAWKMLDIARAIVDKHGEDTLEKVKILSALGEVSLEREDFETSLTDYHMALSILEKLVELDHRRIIELNFRICLVLEVASRAEEAAKYCKKSIELCKSRLQRLREEVANLKDSTAAVTDVPGSSNLNGRANEPLGVSISEKEEEIELIGGFQGELETKLQDLQLAISNPKSMLSEVLNMASAKLPHGDKNLLKMEDGSGSSSIQNGACGGFDAPVSVASTNGNVTHLGVVGRGVKRASAVPVTGEPDPKRSSLDSSSASEVLNLNSTCKDPEIPK